MKRMISALALSCALALTSAAWAQTACSASNPCVRVGWTNAAMTATVTTSSGGVETAGPGTFTVYKCIGSASTCTQAALAAFIASPASASVWSVAGTGTQTATTAAYSDPTVYGNLLNYAVANAWTGGGNGPVSAIASFQVPAAPVVVPAAPVAPGLVLVTSGTSGQQ